MSSPPNEPIANSKDELRQIWEQHQPRLLAMVRWRIDPALEVRIDAEAVIAEAYLDSCRKWPAYCMNRKLSTYAWLYGIVKDRLIEEWRKASRSMRDLRREAPLPSDDLALITAGLLGTSTSPSSAAARAEQAAHLRRMLQSLDPADRDVLYMRYFDNLEIQEVADVLGIHYDAARKRCRRAVERLKDLWQEHFPSSSAAS